ncbi:WD40 repeat domain-containing protein [Scytonema sp. UIC 10036]|uniref:WD40 repeat domain-containing protein n=1 Tax=Scytonema sp. UIC 10036 TaxID=2304196 RepID=UPI0012DAEDEE|nr:WD40 repeat domain-containing protein [Scytonema sp. UIC 10036]MUG93088.1 WD40 repeat domain-containing protein [Scytonema sp. UIC 10036]
MEPGLKLLIQLVLEFAPVIANFIEKRSEASSSITKFLPSEEIKQVLETVSNASQSISYGREAEQEKIQQQELAVYYHKAQLQIATYQRETALKLSEVNKIFDSWPLRLSPSQILESHSQNGRTPLKIFLAPPKIKFDKYDRREEDISNIELKLAEGLRDFLNSHYSLHDPVRPTEFLAGAWDSKRFHSESSIKALYGMLKTEPILILESEASGDYLNFRIGYWGIGQENYYYKTIAQLPLKEIVYQSAKNRALEWRSIRDELIAMGEDLEEIHALGQDNAANLEILEKEERWRAKGIDVSKLSLKYHVNRQDIDKLCQVLVTCHILAASWVTDSYHLIYHDVPPILPKLLPSLLKDNLDVTTLQAIATGYKQLYQALEIERNYWIPELALQLAQSLSHLSDRTWAKQQLDYSINTWLRLRQVTHQPGRHPLEEMRAAVRGEDEEYLGKLKQCFAMIGDNQSMTYVKELLNTIANLKAQRKQESAYNLSYTLTGHSDKITSVAISSDGLTAVSGSADKTIKVWNLSTGKVIRTLTGNIGEVSSVAVSSDGKFLAVGSCEHPRSNVKVWYLPTGKLIHTLLGHQKPVNCIAISPDGQILATGSNKIKIWNLQTGDRICTLWHSSVVYDAVISSDGTTLASGSSDHKIRLWNPRTGDPLHTFSGHSGAVNSVAMSSDGLLLASGSTDTTVKIWHLDSGEVLHTLTGHSDEVKSVAMTPDGQSILSASADTTIKMWCLQTGELLQTFSGHSAVVNSIAISPNGQFIASGSSDKTLKIWQQNSDQ